MIKIITTIAALLALTSSMFAQVFEVGGPVSSKAKTSLPIMKSTVEMPTFDMQAVLEANAANALNKVGPYMFGYEHQVNMDLNNSGEWSTLANGDRVWRLQVKSADALSLNFVFSDFFIPEGANLHLYNLDKTHMVGAYTSENNNVNNELGTDLVKGEECIIEYYEPKAEAGNGRLLITMVVHGYIDINNFYTEKALNDAGACNMDAICPDGDDWRDEIRSVARIVNGGGVCTGTLVNNTAQDETPYFLTANHCSPQSMGSYVFQFAYESPTCGSQTASNSTSPSGSLNVVNGSVLRARQADSDFGLLELNATPTNPYFSGWDNSGSIPQSAVGIHHPSGDVKKISFDDDVLQTATAMGSATGGTWQIEAWERLTTTEGGSSGSGLWDQNHRLIGQLWGGQAACGNSINDYYGKLSMSWGGNGSSSSASRLSDWLDPQNTGASTLDGWDPNAVTVAFDAALQSTGAINTLCSSDFTPEVKLKNNGTNTLTSATITYNLDGGANQVYNWSGSIATGSTETISLPTMTITGSGSHTFNAVVSAPNGQTDGNAGNDNLALTFDAVPNSMPMFLVIDADCFGSEITWEVRAGGSTSALFSGGPYTDVSPDGETINEEFCLSNGCYDFEIFDSYGDGMATAGQFGCNVNGDFNVNDYYGNNFVTMGTNPDYGTAVTHNFCITSVGVNENLADNAIGMFPNPVSDVLNVLSNDGVLIQTIEILDARGAQVQFVNVTESNSHLVNVSGLAQGVYLVKVATEEGTVVRKIVKK